MRALRFLHRSVLLALMALVVIVVGCGDSGTEPPDELVGTWNATSLVVGGIDLMDDGMTLRFTFSANGEYSFTVTNDFLDFCDPGPNCTDSGDFTVDGSQITFDPGADETTLSYSISGSTLTVTGSIDGFSLTFTFTRQ